MDWQNCVVGRGIWDVARFAVMSLPPAVRRAAQADLVALYAETLEAHGVQSYPFPQCFAHYQAVLPLLFAQQLRFFAGVQCWDVARRAWVEAVTPQVVAALYEAAEAGWVVAGAARTSQPAAGDGRQRPLLRRSRFCRA